MSSIAAANDGGFVCECTSVLERCCVCVSISSNCLRSIAAANDGGVVCMCEGVLYWVGFSGVVMSNFVSCVGGDPEVRCG